MEAAVFDFVEWEVAVLAAIRAQIIRDVPELNVEVMERARQRLDNLTKPIGSLGILEDLILRLSAMTERVVPDFRAPHALIFAADHGVSMQGVSAYEAEVTEQMVVNMCMGSAVSSVLARAQSVPLHVIDVGVRSRIRHPGVVVRKVACGTKNFAVEAAMTMEQAEQAVLIGIEITEQCIRDGADMVVIGEMGIGNTTSSAALLSVFLQLPPSALVGEGTGISAEKRQVKQHLIEAAIQRHSPDATNAWDTFSKLGGFEIGAMAGAFFVCARHRVPVILDGLITTAAAVFASLLNPAIKKYLVASHLSSEPAHAYALKWLGLEPLVAWGMHLGEGTGALSVLPVIRNACQVMAETATFEDARVSNPHMPNVMGNSVSTGDINTTSGQAALTSPTVRDFDDRERTAFYKAVYARRDIRSFLPDEIDEDALSRILAAAHNGPSVGYMQPWNFILIQDKERLQQIQQAVERERVRAAEHYRDLKQQYYLRLKVEGLLQAPITICVTNDPTRGGPHVLGRNTIPETDLMSTACAIENMWLAARVEGVGLGWVSIYQKADVRRILGIPQAVDPVALLSLGYTAHFPEIPLLERVGWGERLNLQHLIYYEYWGNEGETER